MTSNRALFIIATGIAVFVLSGCISPRSFVDPTYPKVTYEELKKRDQQLRLKVVAEFQRNGQHFPKVDPALRDNVERVLRGSGLIVPAENGPDGEIKVIMNNIADTGAAAVKGAGSGLTLGLVGTTVTDNYEMDVIITANGKTVRRSQIKHALHTAIGNTTIPESLETMPPNTAFERVLEQSLLRVLKEMQQSGELSWLKTPSPDHAYSHMGDIKIYPYFSFLYK
jgi:hypothetical protein